MSITTVRKFTVQLWFEEYEFVVNGEHKSLLKFYIHPNSVHEERWVSRLSKTEEPKVSSIIRKRFQETKEFVQIEKETLDTVSYTIFSNMLSTVALALPDKYQNHPIPADRIANMLVSFCRKRISETGIKFRSKCVLIGVEIGIVTLKLSPELKKEIEETERRNYNGSLPACSALVANLERVKLEENSLNKCVICFKEILAGSTMIRTECSHEFHAECITEWFSRINLCPRCRFEMPSGVYDRFLF